MNYAELIDKIPENEKPEILRLLRELEEAKAREAAQDNFIDFVKMMWPGFISGRHHKIMADAFERVASGKLKRLIINMPPRHDLRLSEEVPTINGFKRIQDIAPGDYVFGPDGNPRLVTGKSPVNLKPTYKVTTSDGASVVVSEDHLWTVRFRCKFDDPFVTMSTSDLYERQCRVIGKNNIPKLPALSPIQFPHRELPVDPYVLGVWLGDGSSSSGSIGCGHADMAEMRKLVEACGYETTHNPAHQQFNVLGLIPELREADVFKNKHIPDIYLCASVEQRLALLQGLIDTDGCVTKDGKVTFHNTNEALVDGFLTLVRSFGVKAKKTWRQTSYKGKPSQPSMRVSFKLASAARLPRKAQYCRDIDGNFSRTIRIEPTGAIEETQCLQVANDDGLFVAGRGMIITHNTKSEFASYLLPAWFLGKYPAKKIIQTAHTAELAVGFGRKVRNLVGSADYQKVFSGIGLQSDSKAAGRWSTNKGGEYFAIGVGGAVTGKGADLLIIDDPHSEQEAMMGQFDMSVYDKVFEWYSSGPRQRLQPGGAIVVVMCLTGDTNILMADQSQKKIKDIKIGDIVATYERGKMSASFVSNFQSSGFDDIVKIQTQSGRIIKANKEHPFLVEHKGIRKWARVKDLAVGMSLVGATDANGPLGLKGNPDFAELVKRGSRIIEKIPTLHDSQLDIMENGREGIALAGTRSQAGDCAAVATKNNINHPNKVRSKEGPVESNPVTESPFINTKRWLLNVTTNVIFAAKNLLQKTLALIGAENFASTIATKLVGFVVSCATIVIFQLGMAKAQRILRGLRNTYEFEADVIVRITNAGRAEVFDLEVHQTENFIANGVISHNTRWAKRDLTGQILDSAIKKEGASEWEVIELPAIMPSGEPLWPEFWALEELEKLKAELPISKWAAQYQQDPTSEEGALIKRDWWNVWEGERAPPCEAVITAMDTAFSKTERSDYSACVSFGIFQHPNSTGKLIPNLILLDAWKDKLEFPELKATTVQYYKDWKPDMFIVEKKASGAPLIAELRNAGVPVQEFTPTRATGDKIVRVNSITDIFASGVVWAPEDRFAEEVVEECAAFPSGDHDDYVDAVTMALMRFRQGGFVLPTDEEDIIDLPQFRKEPYY